MARDPKKNMFEEMREAMGERPTTEPQPTHERPTDGPREAHREATSGPTPIRKVRIPEDQWDALQAYARDHSVSTSAAIRMAIADYLRGAR